MKKYLIIDGNSIMNRAFYGVMTSKMFSNKDGVYTNALYGFLNIYSKIKADINPDHISVTFDLHAPTFRHNMYDGYKAGRKSMPDELRMQMPIIKDILREMNISIYEIEGYEADDVIGTVSNINNKAGDTHTYILTGDRDAFQLVSETTTVVIPSSGPGKTEYTLYTPQVYTEKYGVLPIEAIEVKALMGDSSDNIPGVKGVGEKTAYDLIQKYHNIEYIYDNIDTIEIKPRARELIRSDKEMCLLSKQLGTIDLSVPIEYNIDKDKVEEINKEALLETFKYLEFTKMISKFGLEDVLAKDSNEKEEINLEIKTEEITVSNKDDIFSKIIKANSIGYTFDNESKAMYIYLKENDTCFYINTSREFATEYIKQIFESEVEKYGYKTKPQMKFLLSKGIDFKNISFDLEIAYYLLDSKRDKYELEYIVSDLFGIDIEQLSIPKKKECSQMSLFDEIVMTKTQEIDEEDLIKYSKIAKIIYVSKYKVIENLESNGQMVVFNDIEMPLVEVLASMEYQGMKVDKDLLDKLGKEFEEKLSALTNSIYDLAGSEFNINSPQQLGKVLFEDLGFKVIRKTKNGYSTDKEVLEQLEDDHEIIKYILEYRQINKLKSTYIEGLRPLIGSDNRVHTTFNQTITSTGRLSSTEPNMQNIPIRLEEGKKLRRLFIADEGSILLDSDYSQIELRILAHMAKDEHMIDAFNAGLDIHKSTAARVFNIPLEEVTKEQRGAAKAVNFGIVYGISDFGLAKNIGTTRNKAKEYIDEYLEEYSSVKEYMDKKVEEAKGTGYALTMYGRKRYTPEINSSNGIVRKFGERIAINSPIQGTAADIIKLAMVSVYRTLKLRGLESKLILQVHDELIIETKEKEIGEVSKIMKECMENIEQLSVPLEIEMGQGINWYDAKE